MLYFRTQLFRDNDENKILDLNSYAMAPLHWQSGAGGGIIELESKLMLTHFVLVPTIKKIKDYDR